jgi:ATP-dependent RNA helicase SUPV3L1/SUV3
MGLTPPTIEKLMAGFGFRPAPAAAPSAADDTVPRWVWRGLPTVRPVVAPRGTHFAALADLAVHG